MYITLNFKKMLGKYSKLSENTVIIVQHWETKQTDWIIFSRSVETCKLSISGTNIELHFISN